MARGAAATVGAQTFEKWPCLVDPPVDRAVGLRGAIWIREKHSVWDERNERNLLSIYHSNDHQSDDSQKSGAYHPWHPSESIHVFLLSAWLDDSCNGTR